MSTSTTQTKDLWAIAIGKVGDDDKAQLDVHRTEKIAVLDDILSLVKVKQNICLQKRWKFKKSSGQSLVVRDLVDKIAVWVGKFVEVGDSAVQYDPTHAALPWAAVRFLLQITFNDAQTFGAVAEGVETVSRLISRYAIFETAYLHPSGRTLSATQQKLSEALIVLYSAILIYLAKAGRYYKQSTAERLARSIVKPPDTIQNHLELIVKEEKAVDRLAEIMHAEMILAVNSNVTSLHDNAANKIEGLEKLIKAFDEPLVRTVGTLQNLQDQLETEERRGLLTWLSRIPVRQHHDKAYRDVLPSTGLWLLRKANFLSWRTSSSSSTLWLHGIPGAGKSKLSAIVIQKLLDDAAGVENAAPLAYFYCSMERTESYRADPTEILRAILKQLSCPGPDGQIRQVIAEEYKQRRLDAERDGLDVTTLNFSECTQLLLELTSEAPATIVIDGVDELRDASQDLLDVLQSLVDKSSSVLKVFVSSRKDAAIARSLHHASSIRVTSADNSRDVTEFVIHKVSNVIEQKRLLGGRVSNKLREDIISEIIDGAGEMFLWASLQLQHLCNSRIFKLEEDVVAALRRLPPTLKEILDSVYRSVNESADEAQSIAKKIFAWLLAAQAPILASDMMASLIGRSSFVRNDSRESVLSVETILDTCCNLIFFDDHSMIFRFIHPSVREHLEQLPEFTPSITHDLVFRRCVEYYTGVPNEVEVQCEESPLSDAAQMNIRTYAASYWGLHYSRIDDADIRAAADPLLLNFAFHYEGACFKEWLDDAKELILSVPPWDMRLEKLAAVQSLSKSPLLTASIYGLLSILKLMHSQALACDRQVDFNETNIDGVSTTYMSARYGKLATLRFLIAQGGSIDTSGGRYGSPLQAAAFHGHERAVQCLLDHGADPCAPGRFEDVLQAAIAGGHENLINSLLSRETIVSRCNLKAALMNVSYSGNLSAVNVLLNRDDLRQSVSLRDDLSCEPMYQALQLALYRGRASAARTLLAQYQDVNATGGHFGNLVQAAAFGGRETMVRWLIDLGADVHARGRYGSALRAASLGGHNSVVHLLLNHGARVDMKEDNALQAAALTGHLKIVKLLLDRSEGSCNLSACHDDALEAASFKGHLEIVQLLLRNRPKKSSSNFGKEGKKAMIGAVIAGHESIVKLLIEELPHLRRIGRSTGGFCSLPDTLDLLPPEPKNNADDEVSCNSKTVESGGIDVADVRPGDTMSDAFPWDSLTKPADSLEQAKISAQEAHRHTPLGQEYLLRIAAEQGSKRMIERLMACGFELNETGNVNENLSHQPTALEVAGSKPNLEVVELLLSRGAELGKALHFAVRDGDVDMVRTLLAYRPEAELDCFVDPIELQEQHQDSVEWFPRSYQRVDLKSRRLVYSKPRKNISNRSLLALAVEWKREATILALLSHKAKSSNRALGLSMIVAARNGYEWAIRVLLEHGRAMDGAMDTGVISDILLQQSIRDASANGHLHIVKVLLEQCSLDDERSHCICIALCEARTHDQTEIMADLQALSETLDKTRFIGDDLLTMASKRPAYDFRTRTFRSNTHYLENIFDHLSSQKLDSKLYVNIQLEALKGALKAGQYESARFLLKKDTSCSILVTETEILHFAICTMWINKFYKGQQRADPDTSVYGDLIKSLIKHGAPTESYDSLGHTPLFYACSKPIPGIFRILIESKASPWTEHASILGDNLETLIPSPENIYDKKFNLLNVALISRLEHQDNRMYEAHMEWEKIILSLLDLGIQIDPNDANLINFLHVACLKGNLECVQKLANSKANIHAAGRSQENYYRLGTAAHAAVIGAQVKVLQYLLDVGVNVHQKAFYLNLYDENRLVDETAVQTALHAAKKYGNPQERWDTLMVLLEVWDGTDDCTTTLHAAIADRKAAIVDHLLRRSKKVPEISEFPYRNVEIVKLLIDHGTPIHLPREQMMERQRNAVEDSDVSLLELLLARSDLLLINPLSHIRMLYLGDGPLNMIQYLLDHYNCDINAIFRGGDLLLKETYDTNMLLEACKDATEKIIKLLLEHGADPDGPDLADTVLVQLFRKSNSYFYESPEKSTIRLLLDHGADINGSKRSREEAEKHPRTLQPPLLRAVEDRTLPMVEFLVSNGADVNATSGPETPLHLARREGYGEIADYLVLHGGIDRYDNGDMGRRVWERPGLTPVTTESLMGHDQLRFP